MSSRQRKGGIPSELTTKKKFGKNLNKLTKPPAPPIASPSKSGSTAASSRNGLLLLSTKRSSSTGTAPASGLLASKPTSSPTKPMQPLGLTTESYSSAHDALLGAVIGASRNADTQQPPDAWGVAEKQASSVPESHTVRAPALAPKGGVSSGVSAYDPESLKHHYIEETGPAAPQGDYVQVSYMSQRARERADERRLEEDTRMADQKERAAERLRELEAKMSLEKPSVPIPAPTSVIPKSPPAVEQQEEAWSKETDSIKKPRARTLFDPNSDSVCGAKPTDGQFEDAEEEVERPSTSIGRGAVTSKSPCNGHRNGDSEQEPSIKPLIHLDSYETRDRGERDSSAGPRMLFDPKSGSMVAAPSRDDVVSGRGKKGIKPKGHKDRNNGANARDADADNGTKSTRTKGRKDETATQRRDRKPVDDNNLSQKEDSKSSKDRAGKVQPAENRLPRTCGVLYARDERGKCYSVDGCDGDQGYGSHSVRGGRVKNPDEYAKFMEEQQPYELDDANGLDYGMDGIDYDEDQAYYMGQDALYDSDVLQNINGQKLAVQEQNFVQKEIAWVKPNEKIELVTGVDDSPSLQATASPWAPSQAALAAAAAAKEELKKESVSLNLAVDHDIVSDDAEASDDGDHPSFVGLGFDPTENMDSVMQSPAMLASTNELEAVGLSSLTLDDLKSSEATSRSIFAFGSSGTWGTGGTSSDWSMLGTGAGSSHGVSTKGQESGVAGASFLSLSTNNPWGSPAGLSGFGGSGGPGSSSTGD